MTPKPESNEAMSDLAVQLRLASIDTDTSIDLRYRAAEELERIRKELDIERVLHSKACLEANDLGGRILRLITERDRAHIAGLRAAHKVATKHADNVPPTPTGRHDDWQHGWQDGGMEIDAEIEELIERAGAK